MVPSKRFKPVKRVAESREQKAAQALGSSQRQARDQEARLEELKSYHKEYLDRFQEAARAGITAAQLQEYRAFLHKLELAIGEQKKIVQASLQTCSNDKAFWQEKRQRNQALGKVLEKFRSAERKVSESREQKETDERNQRGGSS
jgi:flagellar FliJ protein